MKKADSELDETLGQIQKRYGKHTVQKGSSIPQPDRISTGVFTLDFALLGGIPHNRVSMVVGEKHSGKSMMGNLITAHAQRRYQGQTAVLLDIEGTFEGTWAEKLGVDLDSLMIVPCESGEMAVDAGDAIISSSDTSLLIVDSVAAITPMKELEASAEDSFVGLQARLMGNFIRRMTNVLTKERGRKHYVTVLLLNQFRSKIGGFAGYGEPRSIPGGKAVEYCTSVQMIIKNKEGKGKDSVGLDTMTHNEHAFTITKNKMNGGPRTGEFVIIRENNEEEGLIVGDVDDAATVLAFAKKFGLYSGGGTSWKLNFLDYSLKFGKAREAIMMLREDPDVYWDLRTHIIRMQADKLGMKQEFIKRIV